MARLMSAGIAPPCAADGRSPPVPDRSRLATGLQHKALWRQLPRAARRGAGPALGRRTAGEMARAPAIGYELAGEAFDGRSLRVILLGSSGKRSLGSSG
ncbi:hypothetical protein ACNKHX_25970 [Shigella flexneri]